MLKIGIYDRYLSTAGGGERYSCKMAEILSKQDDYKVDLVTDLYADLKIVSSRLNLDLEKVGLKIFPFLSDEYAQKITGEFDIFINATYLSSLSAFGKRNLYLCYFPTPFNVDFRLVHKLLLIFFRLPALWLFKLSDRLCNGFKDIEVLEGIYDIKRFLLRRGSWSSGKTILIFRNIRNSIKLGLKNPQITKINLMSCKLKISDLETKRTLYDETIKLEIGRKKVVDIPISSSKDNPEFIVEITSDVFTPVSQTRGLRDTRIFGVAVYNENKLNLIKKIILKILGFIPLFLVTFPKNLKFLETYNKIIAISKYSRDWIKKFWNKESIILFPPVDVESFKAGKKEKIILSVGRFFPEHHNKKQLELAQIFIELYLKHPDVLSDYSLYLAGGVENKPGHLEYVEKIKEISQKFPVKILTNIEWKELVELFSRAFIFWHASGMGEDEKKHPEKFEHFGITTVEAMASGCIPIVINKGGQTEIIENGKNGFLFETWDELKDVTLKVCSGSIDIEILRQHSIHSSRKFSSLNFEKELLQIIKEETNKSIH